jgi:multiple sugar transport system substrate-binding protein
VWILRTRLAAGDWFRNAGPAFKKRAKGLWRTVRTFRLSGLWDSLKKRLKASSPDQIPADRYRLLGGAGVLFVFFVINIFLLKQPDISLPLYDSADRSLVFTQWWEHSLDTGVLEELIREFEEQNPEIHIRLDTRSYTEMLELLAGSGESGEVEEGDILGLDPQWFGNPAITVRLEPFAGYHEKGNASDNSDAGTPSGEWGRPLVSFMMPLFYNIDLLEAAGFDRPPKNQTDFAVFAKTTTNAAAGHYGFALALSPEDPQGLYRDILSWIRASGAVANWEGEPEFNPPGITGVLKFLNELQKNGSLAPGSFTKTGKERIEEFKAGRIAMLIASMADARRLSGAGFNFGITTIPPPVSYTGKPLYALDHWYAGISRNSRYKEEALAFIGFLAKRASLLAGSSGAIPWNSNTGAAYTGEDPLLSKAYDIYHTGETQVEFAEGRNTSLFEKSMTQELRMMFEAGRSPEAAAKALQQRWETEK